MKKQTVYLPVKVEDELPDDGRYGIKVNTCDCIDSSYIEEGLWDIEKQAKLLKVKTWLKPQELFVFTSEQLNEYTQKVIKQALETAAEKANVKVIGEHYVGSVVKESITNTFEETFKKFFV